MCKISAKIVSLPSFNQGLSTYKMHLFIMLHNLNIALMNGLAIIFGEVRIDLIEVHEVAVTKWNFLQFCTGLVGGHYIWSKSLLPCP